MSVSEVRKSIKALDDKRDANKKAPKSVERIENLSYGPYGKWNLLDIYYPKASRGKKIPTIISCHGGGYYYGTKKTYYYYCLDLARRGFRVISFNYRLAPGYKYPSPVIDTNNVIRFLKDHQEEYSLDLDNVFLVGDSAGANLAMQMALIYSSPEYRKTLADIDFVELNIKGVALNCGFYDWDDTERVDNMWKWYLGKSLSVKYKESLSLQNYIDTRFPPTIVASCNKDFLLSCAEPFYDILCERGVQARLDLYMPAKKNLWHVAHVDVGKKYSDIWNSDQCAFFKSLSE